MGSQPRQHVPLLHTVIHRRRRSTPRQGPPGTSSRLQPLHQNRVAAQRWGGGSARRGLPRFVRPQPRQLLPLCFPRGTQGREASQPLPLPQPDHPLRPLLQLIKEKLLDLLGKEEDEGSHDENVVRAACGSEVDVLLWSVQATRNQLRGQSRRGGAEGTQAPEGAGLAGSQVLLLSCVPGDKYLSP